MPSNLVIPPVSTTPAAMDDLYPLSSSILANIISVSSILAYITFEITSSETS